MMDSMLMGLLGGQGGMAQSQGIGGPMGIQQILPLLMQMQQKRPMPGASVASASPGVRPGSQGPAMPPGGSMRPQMPQRPQIPPLGMGPRPGGFDPRMLMR